MHICYGKLINPNTISKGYQFTSIFNYWPDQRVKSKERCKNNIIHLSTIKCFQMEIQSNFLSCKILNRTNFSFLPKLSFIRKIHQINLNHVLLYLKGEDTLYVHTPNLFFHVSWWFCKKVLTKPKNCSITCKWFRDIPSGQWDKTCILYS